MVNATRNSTFGNHGAGSSGTPQGTEGEAHAGGHHEQPRDLPPPPPPENMTMAQFLQALREERQASNAAIQQLTQVLVDNPPRNESTHGLGDKKKKQKDSLIDLAMAIIDPYYRDMKAECDKDKFMWHKAWVNKLHEEHIKYTAKDAYTSYEMYRRIIDIRKCLLSTYARDKQRSCDNRREKNNMIW
ncbi:putative ubiquitin-conjugating enzyme E2 26 [Hordeum vulgare]|nr:putative ubiquitin-conjugating enzyme E2 26 [Hordeum vulgare]